MQRSLLSLLLLLGATAASAADLFKRQPADQFRAAGLHKLTDEELAALEAMFERLKTGEIAVIKQEAEQKVAAAEAIKQEAQQKVAAAEAKVQETAAEQKQSGPGWLRALVTLQNTTEKAGKADPVQSRIAGRFRGWDGKTLFRLENGQIWQQNDQTSYVGVDYDSPAVRVYPGMLGAFWMEIEGVNPRVKVKPVKLQ
jgi:hypothetical protein